MAGARTKVRARAKKVDVRRSAVRPVRAKANAPKAKIPGLEVLAVERVDQAVQLLRNL